MNATVAAWEGRAAFELLVEPWETPPGCLSCLISFCFAFGFLSIWSFTIRNIFKE